jgi:hypothetical protein
MHLHANRHRSAKTASRKQALETGRMIIIEVFAAGCEPKHRSTPVIRIDTS